MNATKKLVLGALQNMTSGGNVAAVTWEASEHSMSGTNKGVSEVLAELYRDKLIDRSIICGEHVYKIKAAH